MKDIVKDDFSDASLTSLINVSIDMPAGFESLAKDGIVVSATDPATGLVYKGTTDLSGKVSVRVAHGTYSFKAQAKRKGDAGALYIMNGSGDKVRASTIDPKEQAMAIPLKISKSGQIIIKEFYFGGCTNGDGTSYTKDQYIILYNNSDEIAYLDNMGLGVASPGNAPTKGALSTWQQYGSAAQKECVPLGQMMWVFPGSGNEYPLLPGQQAVISLNAINHTIGYQASVNLGVPGYWALYSTKNPNDTPNHSFPAEGVNIVEFIWKAGIATSYPVSQLSPALVIYSLGGKTPNNFKLDNYSPDPKNPTFASSDCILVNKSLVIDAVECFREVTDTKRLMPEVDLGFIKQTASKLGESVHRKIDTEATAAAGGRIVYMDTNDSSQDFEVRKRASLYLPLN